MGEGIGKGVREEEEADEVKVAPGAIVGSLETFQRRVDWIDPRSPEAASATPIGKPENHHNPERERERERCCR